VDDIVQARRRDWEGGADSGAVTISPERNNNKYQSVDDENGEIGQLNNFGRVCCITEPEGQSSGSKLVHVYWYSENDNSFSEQTVIETDLEIVDRTILHGDCVYMDIHANGTKTRRYGFVVSCHIEVDVADMYSRIHKGIADKYLFQLQPFRVGTYVISNDWKWIGRIITWTNLYDIQFETETEEGGNTMCVCQVNVCASAEELFTFHFPQNDNNNDNINGLLEPLRIGDVVGAVSEATFRNATWLRGEYDGSPEGKAGKIIGISPNFVFVDWIRPLAHIPTSASESTVSKPESRLSMDKVRSLCYFDKSWWNLGDQARFKMTFPSGSTCINEIVEITRIRTKVDVQWQSGEIAHNISTTKLKINENTLESCGFFPYDVVRMNFNDKKYSSQIGIVCSSDVDACTCQVRWFPSLVENSFDKIQACIEQRISRSVSWTTEESAFDLKLDPDLTFRVGDIVTSSHNEALNIGEVIGFVCGVVKVALNYPDKGYDGVTVFPPESLILISENTSLT